ncbi:MAG: hypothetical protein IPM16_16350 [Chloroflexi bacterium]|nr:hypothetical protein [Chloroflexota bacterium]
MNTMIKVPGVSLKLDHMTLKDGATDDPNANNDKGGAIHVESSNATLTVTNARFIDNSASDPENGYGGAIYSNGVMTLEKVYFDGNSASQGGAIATNASPFLVGHAAVIKYVDFKSNSVTTNKGGAIYVAAGTIKVRNSNFRNNSAVTNGAIRHHIYSYTTATAVANAKKNYWNNPTVPSSANEQGVNTLEQLSAKVEFEFDPPAQVPPCGTRGRQLCIPTPTPTGTPNYSLADFGIIVTGNWSQAERDLILSAAIKTGDALSAMGVAANPVDAFREVLQGESSSGGWRSLVFSRADLTPNGCKTSKTPDNPSYSANIQCDPLVSLIEHTVVHEFGHVLVSTTTVNGVSDFRNAVEHPGGSGTPLRAPSGGFVMGPRTLIVNGPNLGDWQRSDYILDSGWGSGARWSPNLYDEYPAPPVPAPTPTLFPIRIPKIGPCGEGAPSDLYMPIETPHTFQQNPCTFSDSTSLTDEGLAAEIEEAAADMFLNWVYWKLNPTEGFKDLRWRYQSYTSSNICDALSGCPDPDNSGQVRAAWMDETLLDIFSSFGW